MGENDPTKGRPGEQPPRSDHGAERHGAERHYERITHYVRTTPWAIHPEALATIVAIVAERRSGRRPSAEEIRARIGGGRERRQADLAPGGVAVIPVDGTIIPKADFFSEVSGATSIVQLQAAFREALASADVSAIVLDVNSPGGSVDLVPEMAAEIMAARGTKPIIAVANTWAASAAYWIASAAEQLIVTPSGEVGSVGVYSVHEDLSAAMAMKGIKTTLVSAGEYKVEGNPFEPLSPEARAEMQAKVDAYYEMFVNAVAAQRGVSAQEVLDRFGQGRMVMAADAVDRGMADAVGTLEQVLARFGDATPAPEPAAEPPVTPEPPAPAASRSVVITGRREAPEDAPAHVKRLARMEREHRVMPGGGVRGVEIREASAEELELVGYAVIYDTWYEVEDAYGTYQERVARGAHDKTLSDGADVRLLINHDDLPLARTRSGTLALHPDETGLYVQARLDASDPDVQRIQPKMRRRDLREMSHSFRAVRQEWDADYTHRTLLETKLYDVSIVTFAASTSTWSELRALEVLAELAGADASELALELRSTGGARVRNLIDEAMATLQALRDEPRGIPQRDRPATMTREQALRDLELLKLRMP